MAVRALSRLNFSKAKLLLIGEGGPSMEILSQILLGFGVNHAHKCISARDGLAVAAATAFDLILIDNDMQQMSGAEVCRELRADQRGRNYTSPVLVLSALTSTETVAAVRDAGAHFVLAKPIVPGVLLERIEWIARSEREFVTSDGYRGPDRRFQQSPLPSGIEERRNETLKMLAAPERALDQSEIDSLFG
jgi:DNA-binding response OmpR family regulator